MQTKTIHIVFNSHIDPVWFWPWSSGLDAVLNTCESMCNLLDRHPDVIFTRGEAWAYEEMERVDPRLFQRIKRHIKAGRWEIIGGWYVQPDCNLPGYRGFEKQIEFGRAYFKSRFNTFPATAYNVDSFGHAACLPELMTKAGQKNYIMMRPQENELSLPARLFRWRTKPGGGEIITFRIAGSYNGDNAKGDVPAGFVEKSLSELPKGLTHTMCFLGVGDHGGGPTEALIQWCKANRDIIPGARLKFSSPSRFFRAVARERVRLPLVTGELQMHAVGCYSVHRKIKTGLRRTEQLLAQAEEALKHDPALAKLSADDVEAAWRWVCFNHFHDTLGGTCVPSTYPTADAQLGFGQAVADKILHHALRRKAAKLPPDLLQRLVIGNFSGANFHGWVEHEAWMEGLDFLADKYLIDEKGNEVPYQNLEHEAIVPWNIPHFLFKLAVKRGELRILRIARRTGPAPKPKNPPPFSLEKKANGWKLLAPGISLEVPALQLIEDTSDTWGHDVHIFDGKLMAEAQWDNPEQVESGPLLNAWRVKGKIGQSGLMAEWRHYADEPFFELRLHVVWSETHRLLRLNWHADEGIGHREDGVSGGGIRRESDGKERPVRDRTLLYLKDGRKAGAIFPDTFSLSGTDRDLRLTLLRSSIMAYHIPYPETEIKEKRLVISDQGGQAFIFRFYPPGKVTANQLEHDALALQQRPVIADVTRGMPGLVK